MVDLVDRIETTRFLGFEFLAWLWMKIDAYSGHFDVPSVGSITIGVESPLLLIDWYSATEKVTVAGASPSSSPEARQALKQGKLPMKLVLRLEVGAGTFVFAIDGRMLALAGLKLPPFTAENDDEHFFERMRMLEQTDQIVHELYEEFLAVRLSPLWEGEGAGMLREWVRTREPPDPKAYVALLKRAQK